MPKPVQGKLSLGFAQGTVSQLVGEYFNRIYGLDITSVPYRGGALVIPGHAWRPHHHVLADAATGLPLIREGQIKVLAVTSPQRSPDLPQVPTMKELGSDELSLEYWAGAWAPAGTPADVVTKLNAVINEALRSPEHDGEPARNWLPDEDRLAAGLRQLSSRQKFRAGPRW